jgi:hypothetical protein
VSDLTDEELAAIQAASRARRAFHRTKSPLMLAAAGIPFTSHNEGAHLIVADEWHFWPGTGRWNHRGPPFERGRGVDELINRIKDTNDTNAADTSRPPPAGA